MMNRLISSTLVVAMIQAYTQSLSDCNAFVALFPSTCTGGNVPNGDILTQSGGEVQAFTCTGDATWCVGKD